MPFVVKLTIDFPKIWCVGEKNNVDSTLHAIAYAYGLNEMYIIG